MLSHTELNIYKKIQQNSFQDFKNSTHKRNFPISPEAINTLHHLNHFEGARHIATNAPLVEGKNKHTKVLHRQNHGHKHGRKAGHNTAQHFFMAVYTSRRSDQANFYGEDFKT